VGSHARSSASRCAASGTGPLGANTSIKAVAGYASHGEVLGHRRKRALPRSATSA
jgi:hypothetical protein